MKFLTRTPTNPSVTLLDTLKYRKQTTSLYNYKILLKRMDCDVSSSPSKGRKIDQKNERDNKYFFLTRKFLLHFDNQTFFNDLTYNIQMDVSIVVQRLSPYKYITVHL